MPKVKSQTQKEQMNRDFKAKVAGQMKVEHMSNVALSKNLGIHERTFRRKLDNPDTFTLGEIRALREIFPGIEIK